MRICYVQGSRVAEVWHLVEPILKRATDASGGRYTVADLAKKIDTGEIQLWIVIDERNQIIAANTTTFTQYPQLRATTGLYIAGDRLPDWKDDMVNVVEKVARNTESRIIEFVGRPGWGPVLKPNGFKLSFCTYEKRLW